MSEAELLASPDFLAWCRAWEEERWCPAQFADWCLDCDFQQGYEACVWAHEKEERWGGWREHRTSRVCPSIESSGEGRGRWYWLENFGNLFASDVPTGGPSDYFPTFPAAIAYYLTHFDRELAAKYPPKRQAVPA